MNLSPMSIEEWKAGCEKSSHVRGREKVTYNTTSDGVINANNDLLGRSILIGCYITKPLGNTPAGQGWYHD